MYTVCIIMIAIASILLILAVLVQSPKSGMAANFGAANQTMGVRQTTDFLEKFTWAMIAAVVFFTLLSVVSFGGDEEAKNNLATKAGDKLEQFQNETQVEGDETIVLGEDADANAGEQTTTTETGTDASAE